MPKTVIIPLAVVDLIALRGQLLQQQAGWGGVRVDFWAKYLGFAVGPARGHRTYDKALDKYLRRAAE